MTIGKGENIEFINALLMLIHASTRSHPRKKCVTSFSGIKKGLFYESERLQGHIGVD